MRSFHVWKVIVFSDIFRRTRSSPESQKTFTRHWTFLLHSTFGEYENVSSYIHVHTYMDCNESSLGNSPTCEKLLTTTVKASTQKPQRGKHRLKRFSLDKYLNEGACVRMPEKLAENIFARRLNGRKRRHFSARRPIKTPLIAMGHRFQFTTGSFQINARTCYHIKENRILNF